jgi:DNA-binding MarR family transcriptional regulator
MSEYERAFDRVLELAVVLNEDMSQGLAQLGLTRSRAHVLWELHHRGPTTQRVLADVLRVSARNITGLVDALVATGFVTRQPHPTDRRATLVTLTEHGARTAGAMARDHRELAGALFSGMPVARFDCFVEGLDQVVAELRDRAAASVS